MSYQYIISVDLGGTNLRVGAVREDGLLEEKEKHPSAAKSGCDVVLNNVLQAIQDVAKKIEMKHGVIRGVALGFPGIVDPQKGIVYKSPHFPDWADLDIFSYFKTALPWPIVVDNDAHMAARGEAWKGAGRGLRNFVMLTFGTGLGGGVIADGKIFHGDRGFAGELGHVCIESQGPLCACGSHGCLEMYVSTHGIRRLVETMDDAEARLKLLDSFSGNPERVTPKGLHELALDGDISANVIFKRMGYYLGIGMASLVNTLGIETFILGGGISEAWDFFVEAAKKELRERTYQETANHIEIKKAVLGDDAGLVGGGACFHPQEKE